MEMKVKTEWRQRGEARGIFSKNLLKIGRGGEKENTNPLPNSGKKGRMRGWEKKGLSRLVQRRRLSEKEKP